MVFGVDFSNRFIYHVASIFKCKRIGGPPRIAGWWIWSGPEGSSHSQLLQVPGV